jgi:hypothetical protein
VHVTHPAPHAATVSGLQVVAPPQAFVPPGQTQAPTPSKTKPGSQVKAQTCCVTSGLLLSQKTFAFGMGWQAVHADPQWLASSA